MVYMKHILYQVYGRWHDDMSLNNASLKIVSGIFYPMHFLSPRTMCPWPMCPGPCGGRPGILDVVLVSGYWLLCWAELAYYVFLHFCTNSFYISFFPWTVQLKCVPIRKSNKIIYVNLRNIFFPILVISSLDALNCIIWVFPWRVYTTTPFMRTVGGLSSGTYPYTHFPWDSWGLLLFLHGAVGSLLQCQIPIVLPWDSWDPCFEIP